MKIRIVAIGRTNKGFVNEGFEEYLNRLKRYIKIEFVVIHDVKNSKNLSPELLMAKEEELIISFLGDSTEFILLDENGAEYTSVEFSQFLQSKMISGAKELTFLIGGAFGVSEKVKKRAVSKIALSKFTFSHQMVRMILAEQIYRAMTILKGEPYHHQ